MSGSETTPPTDLPARIRDVIAHKGCLSDATALAAADEIERLRAALRIIAGEQPCIDNLLGDSDIARIALHGR